MTELNYQPLRIDRPSRTRSGAWISLFVLGVLYALFGTLMAVGLGFANMFLKRGGASPSSRNVLLVIGGLFSAMVLILGAVEIWLAFKVRKASRRAAVGGFVLTLANAILIGIVLLVCLVMLLFDKPDPEAVIGMLFYLIPLVCNVWTAHILFRLLKEMSRRARELARAERSDPV
ncbi:MAG TPA: hypothetical protein VHM90_09130 [Phycisphaerae bacterium]|jgi:hypothetical protein|nr:hypothetical protein [Phycisphaerae bacterium]